MPTERQTYENARAVGSIKPEKLHCLVPFDRREGLSLAQAAKIAGKPVDTVRLWCLNHDIGRRVGGGV